MYICIYINNNVDIVYICIYIYIHVYRVTPLAWVEIQRSAVIVVRIIGETIRISGRQGAE